MATEWMQDIEPESGRDRWRCGWATIWLGSLGDFVWHTWDEHGTGGENGIEISLRDAKDQATLAAIRQGFVTVVRNDADPHPHRKGIVMATFEDSDFVVVFTGEGAWSTLCHGWEATRKFALSEFLTEDDDQETRDAYVNDLEDDDSWEYTENGKSVDDRLLCRHIEIGEISSLMIVRIIDQPTGKGE